MSVFHDAVVRALGGEITALSPWLDQEQAGAFAVYRNTSVKARIDALRGNFPVVAQLVGEDWFGAAAAIYAEARPSDDPVMAAHGEDFPEWLADFEPARDLPYLALIARMDRAWIEAHLSADACCLDYSVVSGAGAAALAGQRLVLHPSVRLFWCDWTAPSLWLAHRHGDDAADLVWEPGGEGLMIHRPDDTVLSTRLTLAAWTFLDACRAGRSVGSAALSVAALAPRADTTDLLAGLLDAGAFTALRTGTGTIS